jgi:nitroreductase
MKVFYKKIKKNIYLLYVLIKLVNNYIYDISRYLLYSNTFIKERDKETVEGRIIARYHVIEKGLALPETRLGFGKENIIELINLINKHHKTLEGSVHLKASLGALNEYLKFHDDINYDFEYRSKIIDTINKFRKTEKKYGGVKTIKKSNINKYAKGNFTQLINSRHSIRNYTNENIPSKLVKKAIKLAQKTPSVCNRQINRVYLLKNKQLIEKALSVQTGNRGFNHTINQLIIVTCNLSYLDGVRERNQAYIDGGMFSMSLLYSLHYLGLGACALNWSANKKMDKEIREYIPIKKEEVIIMMISYGNFPEEIQVANSQRNILKDIVKEL